MSFRIHFATDQGRVERRHPEATLRIGRGAGSDLRFDDSAVAIEHAVLRCDTKGWWLSDLGSTSGTYVNGQPIDTAQLNPGDRIEIGNHRIVVASGDQRTGQEIKGIQLGSIELRVSEAITDLPSAPSEAVDWLGAFGLRRGLLNKGFVALVLAATALLVMLVIPRLGRYSAYQPGTLSAPHREAAIGCFDCHQPWRGVVSDACATCHPSSPSISGHVSGQASGTASGPASGSTPVAVSTPKLATPAPDHHTDLLVDEVACATCHLEHAGLELLQSTGDVGCVDCHSDLRLGNRIGAVYETSITDFSTDHPEFTVTLSPSSGLNSASDSGPRRLPVDSEAARSGDPGSIAFSHRGHLESRLIAANPEWQSLACIDCHQPEGDDLLAVNYELHCQRCHALTFDDRFPDLQAPHDTPARVQAQLFSEYQNRQPNPPAGQPPILVARLLALQQGDEALGISARRNLSALYAAADLFEENCSTCHQMNLNQVLDGEAEPLVEPTGWPERYQVHARFAHRPHVDLNPDDQSQDGADRPDGRLAGNSNCADCHQGIATSTSSEQLHLPGIASCTSCHGDSTAPAWQTTLAVEAPTTCDTCHRYHSPASDLRLPRANEPTGSSGETGS